MAESTRKHVLRVMQSYVGMSEADHSYIHILNVYNGNGPLPRGVAMKPGMAWCCATVCSAALEAGVPNSICPKEMSVGQLVELYKSIGRWVEDDNHIPLPGELVCYDWQDTGEGDCVGWPDHVGMVESVHDGVIAVIEGNMPGGVCGRKPLEIGARYIRGFCDPNYELLDGEDARPGSFAAEIASLPDWAQGTVQKLVDRGLLQGNGKRLNLSPDLQRTLVILDRAGAFDR